ncbi:complement C1q subcomponent subunit B-like [Diretmus argenteus]
MGGYYGLAFLVGVASLLSTGQCDVSCRGQDGRPGEAGVLGRNGMPGPKGEKGEPAVMAAGPEVGGVLLKLKGEQGSRGSPGIMGPKGLYGDLGHAGPYGEPGIPGPPGVGGMRSNQDTTHTQAAFSVVRTSVSYPAYDQRITFQKANINEQASRVQRVTGVFTCKVPGVYYFVFHSMSKVSMCLRLVSQALGDKKLGFCDYNTRNQPQLLSGGVVLQLAVGEVVWLESFKDQQPASVLTDNQEKQIVFTGFLIF